MRITAAIVLAFLAGEPPPADLKPPARHVTVTTAEELQAFFAQPKDDVFVRIAPGEYHLTPKPYTDPTCGNCPPDKIDTKSETTVGLHLRGRRIYLMGPREGERPIIHTNAGYGILIEDCEDAVISRLVITGGTRSADGNATDGAIVVRNSTVDIGENLITNNLGDSEIVARTVSGVMGIVGREDSRMTIHSNRIVRNSWDGIALYRDSDATIINNLIDGVDAATGATLGGGRGVGVGITWNANALVRGNCIRNYWKGIGVFVDASAVVDANVVEDILTWGISLWSASENNASATIRNNVVHRTGACGVSLASTSELLEPGRLFNNAIARTGQNPAYDPSDRYCHQCSLAIHRVPEHFQISGNYFYANRRGSDDLPDHDVSEEEFRAEIANLCEGLLRWEHLRTSAFAREFCGLAADDAADGE